MFDSFKPSTRKFSYPIRLAELFDLKVSFILFSLNFFIWKKNPFSKSYIREILLSVLNIASDVVAVPSFMLMYLFMLNSCSSFTLSSSVPHFLLVFFIDVKKSRRRRRNKTEGKKKGKKKTTKTERKIKE